LQQEVAAEPAAPAHHVVLDFEGMHSMKIMQARSKCFHQILNVFILVDYLRTRAISRPAAAAEKGRSRNS
jgi:hypothetical protein